MVLRIFLHGTCSDPRGPVAPVPLERPGSEVVSVRFGPAFATGDTLTYQWTQVSGPTGTLTNPNSANASFTV